MTLKDAIRHSLVYSKLSLFLIIALPISRIFHSVILIESKFQSFFCRPSGPAKNVLSGAATISMWEILSNLAKIGERAGFTIDTTIQNEKLVFVIGNIPEDKAATLLIQELLAIIFARLFDVESHITHTKNTTTTTISMN